MVKFLLNKYPWNIKANNVKEFENKCITIFNYILNSNNFNIVDIYTTAKYFGFNFKTKSLVSHINLFTPGSKAFNKQIEFAKYIREYTEKKVYNFIDEYKNQNNITKINKKIVGRIIRNNFPDTYYLMPIAFNFGNFTLQK